MEILKVEAGVKSLESKARGACSGTGGQNNDKRRRFMCIKRSWDRFIDPDTAEHKTSSFEKMNLQVADMIQEYPCIA